MNAPSLRAVSAAFVVALFGATAARADLVGFDDLSGFQTPVPDGYAGLHWSNFADVAGALMGGPGFARGVVSGPNVAYNVGGASASISTDAGSAFALVGGNFTAASVDNLSIHVVGWLGGNPLAGDDVTFAVGTSGPTLQTFNFIGVDRVTFTASGGADTRFVLDDVELKPVPEPASVALAAFGGVMLALGCRHTQKNRQKSPAPRDR